MVWLGLLIGLLVGAVAMYFLSKGREGSGLQALAEQHANEKRDLLQRSSEKEALIAQAQREVVTLTASVATETQRNRGLEEKLATQKQELEALQAKLTHEFKVIADTILEEKGKKLGEQQHKELGALIKPLQERITEFKIQVEKAYEQEGRERFALKGEIARLVEQNQKLSLDADNLTKALKGDSKMQGDWGEMILERILEGSGLVEGEEYSLQTSTTLTDGSRLRPDAVINLPGGKHIVIDAKVSLTHYERYSSSVDEAERERLAKSHVDSVRAHMKALSQKDYPSLYRITSPEFVLMFVPIEAAFYLAQSVRREIQQEAIDQRIYIVTHSTLMASLRLFHSVWKNERIARNHMEIAERAGTLVEKFIGFTEDLGRIGKQLEGAQDSYKDAVRKLSEGPGNLVRQAEMLKELGAKTNKNIHPKLVQRSLEESSSNA
jgi:DNA recombination protein RmuC